MKTRPHFFCGVAEGVAVGLAPALGLAAADGAAAGSASEGAGDGCAVAGRSVTTERGPVIPGKEKIKAKNMKITAATIVAFSKGFCAPRGPNAV